MLKCGPGGKLWFTCIYFQGLLMACDHGGVTGCTCPPSANAETWPEDMKRLLSDMKLVAQTCDVRGKETKAAATPGSQPGSLGLGGTLQGLGSCELHNSWRFFRAGGRSCSEQLGGNRGMDCARSTAPGGETYVQRVSCRGCPPLRMAGLGTLMEAGPALSCCRTE